MKINKVSAIKIYVFPVIILIFMIVYFVATQNTIVLPPLIIMSFFVLVCTIFILCIADLEIENEKLKVIYFFRVKTINLNELVISDMDESHRGMFGLHTNIGYLMAAYTHKNYQVIKQAILMCKKSNVTPELLKILVKEQNLL